MAAMNLSDRGTRLAPPLAGLAALLLFVAPVLAPSVQLYYRDTGRLYYPVKLYIAQALQHGRIAWWDTMTEGGLSLLGQVTPGLLHPFTLLYAALPFDLAFKLNHLAGLLLGGIGAYRLARRLSASRWAAVAGGAAYGGCGYLVSMASSNLPYALGAGSLPIAVDAFLGFIERRGSWRLLWAAAALALVGYAGDPQSMWFAGVIGGGWALFSGAAAGGWRGALRSAGLTLAWAAVALALAAPMALPASVQLRRTSRAEGLTEVERRMFTNHPARLFGLLVPRAFEDVTEREGGEPGANGFTIYQEYFSGDDPPFADSIIFGAPALLLAGCAAFAGRRGRILLLAALVVALASTGDALGIERALQLTLPGGRLFRYAEKMIGPACLLLALGAALGADVAFGGTRRAATALAAAAAALAAACLGAALLAGSGSAALTDLLLEHGTLHDPVLAGRFLIALRAGAFDAAGLSLTASLIAALHAARGKASLAALGAACCTASVFASSSGLLPVTSAELMRGPYLLGELLLRRAGPSPGRWRMFVDQAPPPVVKALPLRVQATYGLAQALMPQFNSVNDIEGTAIYFSAGDVHYANLIEKAPATFFSLFDVRFHVIMPQRIGESRARAKGYSILGPGYRVSEQLRGPRAFLVGQTRRASSAQEALGLVASREFDPRRQAVVLGDGPLPEASDAALPAVEMRRPVAEQVIVEADAPAPALLVISEHFDPGWRATVDGRPAPVLEVDLGALGVSLPAGHHHVTLWFWPRLLTAGLLLAAATIAVLLLAGLVSRRLAS